MSKIHQHQQNLILLNFTTNIYLGHGMTGTYQQQKYIWRN